MKCPICGKDIKNPVICKGATKVVVPTNGKTVFEHEWSVKFCSEACAVVFLLIEHALALPDNVDLIDHLVGFHGVNPATLFTVIDYLDSLSEDIHSRLVERWTEFVEKTIFPDNLKDAEYGVAIIADYPIERVNNSEKDVAHSTH